MLKRAYAYVRRYVLEEILFFVGGVFLFVQPLDVVSIFVISISYIFLVLILNDTFLRRGIKKGIQDIKKERQYGVLVLIFVALLLIWQVNTEAIFFLTLFGAFALYAWDSRVIATGALVSLSSCPVLLIAKQDALAEQMAVYAYYFLVMTVVLQILELRREGENTVPIMHKKVQTPKVLHDLIIKKKKVNPKGGRAVPWIGPKHGQQIKTGL